MKPCERKTLAGYAIREHEASLKRACRLFKISRTVYCYKAKKRDEDTFISDSLLALAEKNRGYGFWKLYALLRKQGFVKIEYIQPGKPAQNAYTERFNRTYREEVLDMNLFQTIQEVQEITNQWILIYNGERPHQSLGNLTPWEFAEKLNAAKYHSLFNSIKESIVGVCGYCAHAFETSRTVQATDIALIDEFEGHPSFRKLITQGYQIITF